MKVVRKVWLLLCFIAFYVKELIRANLRVAHDAVTPTHHMRPGIIAVPIEAQSDFEILLLSNLISMTPGTLSIDVSTDRRFLYIHAMYIEDPEELRTEIRERFERRVLDLLR